MADTKYRKKYCRQVVEYFLKFIELRDDPEESDKAERRGMVPVKIENGKAKVEKKPSTGYPTLTKFAIAIGVTPRTIRNWRNEHDEFDEACEFAEAIFNDVLDERSLTGKWDGKVAMKIRELRANAKKGEDGIVGGGLRIEIHKHISEEDKLELKEWEGDVVEDTEYTKEN